MARILGCIQLVRCAKQTLLDALNSRCKKPNRTELINRFLYVILLTHDAFLFRGSICEQYELVKVMHGAQHNVDPSNVIRNLQSRWIFNAKNQPIHSTFKNKK